MVVLILLAQRKNSVAPWVFGGGSTVIHAQNPPQQSITPEPSLDTSSLDEITENMPDISTQPTTPPLLDLNTATQADFEMLPYIGAQKASDILAYRERIGIFSSVEELMDVSGIGESIYGKITPLVTVIIE